MLGNGQRGETDRGSCWRLILQTHDQDGLLSCSRRDVYQVNMETHFVTTVPNE
jgi:hypothetical protein